MAGAKKCAASVDRNRENRQPLPGAGESVDAGTQKMILSRRKHPTSNIQGFPNGAPVECWLFDVGSWMFRSYPMEKIELNLT
jgi:hypothetical protein